MLTPTFELQQDSNFLTIIIKAPFAKVTEVEIFIEDDEFKFYSKPYFLRLSLPANIVEDGRESANYDAEKGIFTIIVPKATPGENFEGLSFLTQLLAPKRQDSTKQPLIEVLDSNLDTNVDDPDDLQEEEFDWFVDQQPYEEETTAISAPKYGFAGQKTGILKRLQAELVGVIDIKDPDSLSLEERQKQRVLQEESQFSGDHYIADLMDDDSVQEVLRYRPMWNRNVETKDMDTWEHADSTSFTYDEKEKMLKLPRKEYLLDGPTTTSVYLGLVDIMYAYAYNHRTTCGENNVESGWNISKLSGTLSCLEVYSSLKDVLVCSVRRSLCYPLFRHWDLSCKIISDTQQILTQGRSRVLKCLLEIHALLLDTDSRYILNDLYITDYCVWIQTASDKQLESLSHAIEKVKLEKADVDFHLSEFEESCRRDMEAGSSSAESDDESTGTSDETTDSDDSSTEDDESHTASADHVIEDAHCSKQKIELMNAETSEINMSDRHLDSEETELCNKVSVLSTYER